MGYILRRQLREALDAKIAGLPRLVALEIADDANDVTRLSFAALDDLARWTGAKDSDVVRRTLKRLAADGWEFRVPIGKGKDGRLLYAVPGRRLTFRVPDFRVPVEGTTVPPTEAQGVTTVPPSQEGTPVTPDVDVAEGGTTVQEGGTTVQEGGTTVPSEGTVVPPFSSAPHGSPHGSPQLLARAHASTSADTDDSTEDEDQTLLAYEIMSNAEISDELDVPWRRKVAVLVVEALKAGIDQDEIEDVLADEITGGVNTHPGAIYRSRLRNLIDDEAEYGAAGTDEPEQGSDWAAHHWGRPGDSPNTSTALPEAVSRSDPWALPDRTPPDLPRMGRGADPAPVSGIVPGWHAATDPTGYAMATLNTPKADPPPAPAEDDEPARCGDCGKIVSRKNVHLETGPDGVEVLVRRCTDCHLAKQRVRWGRKPAAKGVLASLRPAWCGDCHEDTRMRETDTGDPYPCPKCGLYAGGAA